MKVSTFAQRRFDAARMQKLNLFETERFFCDVYCLEPGQSQKVHAHAGSDKGYAVLEGTIVARVGGEERVLKAGEHGVENRSQQRAALLVFMAPKP